MNLLPRLLAGALLFALAACPKATNPPTASAGADRAANIGDFVQLDGSASSDPQALPLTYQWTFRGLPPGSRAALNDPTIVNPSFAVDVSGAYVLDLVVSNGLVPSRPATVTITAAACGGARPVVDGITFAPAMVNVGTIVQLAGSASDADERAPCNQPQGLTYAWTMVSQPAGSRAALNNRAATNPSFTADVAGDYVASLVVTDVTGRASPSRSLTITAGACGGATPVVSISSAVPITAQTGQTVQLSAMLTDADNLAPCSMSQTFTWAWAIASQPSGSRASFNNAAATNPSFVADVPGSYTVSVVVTDSTGRASLPATTNVTVLSCGSAAPVVASVTAVPAAPNAGQTVQLTSSVTDTDTGEGCGLSETFTYAWSLFSQPSGSAARLNNIAATNPSFLADVPGDYVLRLVVTDSEGHASAPRFTTVTASTCGSALPVVSAAAASPASPTTGQVVQLSATVTDADNAAPCSLAQTFAWSWSIVGLPAGSRAALNNASAAKPSFVADVPGDYALTVTATDSTGRASAQQGLTVTASGCGNAVPSVSSIAAAPASPGIGSAVQLSAVVTDADTQAPCNLVESFSYQWSLAALPAGSRAQIQAPGAANPSFLADQSGDYIVRLVVTDAAGHPSAPRTFTVTASACGGASPAIASLSATPSAPSTGATVQLGAVVTDADNGGSCNLGQSFTYGWTLLSLPAGSHASLNAASASNPSFVPDLQGDYVLSLTVWDSTGRASAARILTVTASSCGNATPVSQVQAVTPVVAGPGASVTAPNVPVDSTIQLSGQASTDADNGGACNAGQTLFYRWRFISLPSGSSASLNNAAVVNPSFRADVPGTYAIGLVVTDSTNRTSTESTLTVTADPALNILFTPTGFAVTTLAAGGAQGMNGPRGVTADGSGAVYVVQSGSRSVTRHVSGTTSLISSSGLLGDPQDIVFDPGSSRLLVTQASNRIVQLALNGNQSTFATGSNSQFYGITIFTNSGGQSRVVVADTGNDELQVFDPSNGNALSQLPFGFNLQNPWGATAAAIGGQDTYFAADFGARDVWRNVGGTANRLADSQLLDEARDVVLTPCPTQKLIVASRANGTLVVLTNCSTNNCSGITNLAAGFSRPVGLWFESASSLLVTDESRNALYRMTGNFCGL